MSIVFRHFFPARLLSIGALLLSGLSGCKTANSPAVAPVPRVPPASLVDASVRVLSLPLYHQAEQACRRKDYLQAARLLQHLSLSKGLSAEQVAFCRQQRAICLKDAGIPVVSPTARRLPPASLPASPESPSQTPQQADCGPRALLLVCQKLGVKTTLAQLRHAAGTTQAGTSLAGLQQAAQAVGLRAEGVQVSREALAQVEGDALAWVNGRHFVAVLGLQGEGARATATVRDPNETQEKTIAQERLLSLYSGYLLLVHR